MHASTRPWDHMLCQFTENTLFIFENAEKHKLCTLYNVIRSACTPTYHNMCTHYTDMIHTHHSKLINTSVQHKVDERAINKGKLNTFTIHENQTPALNSASSIGCNIINIGPQDIMYAKPHLILSLLWQVKWSTNRSGSD